MAKRNRQSIFDADTTETQLKTAAKKAQNKAMDNIPAKDKDEKLMHLYVDTAHHRQAKIKAAAKGMKLGEYIQWLIAQDKVTV